MLIELEEYESWVGRVDPVALDALTVLAGDRLGVTRLAGGQVEIKATAHVGIMVTPALSVRVRPKVDLDNLFYLLGLGDDSWTVERAHAPYAAQDDDLVPAVVRLFCREVDTITSRGLLHGYVPHEEDLLALRGRVDVVATMRRPWQRSPVPCRFDEFIPDIWLNRVLLAALTMARRLPLLPADARGQLHLLAQRFETVSPTPIDVGDVDRWTPSRNNRHYRVAVQLAGLILRRLSLADRTGRQEAASFTIDMNKLFEDFVGRQLAARLPATLQLTEQYPTSLDVGGRLGITPDYVVHPTGQPRRPLYVADAKYKLTEARGVVSDHYQLLSYATVFGLDEGTLIYCQRPATEPALLEPQAPGTSPPVDSGDPPVESIIVRGAGIEHFVYRLDLSGRRPDIDHRLDDLAIWLLHRIAVTEQRRAAASLTALDRSPA